MMVQAQEEMGEGSEVPTDPHDISIITQPSSSQPQRKQKSRRPKEKDTQTAQAQEITSLKKRVKKLEKKGGSRTHKLKRLYKGRYGDEDMFGVNDLDGNEVVVESEVTDKAGDKRNIVEEAVVMADAVTIPDADYQLVERLHAQEQHELIIEEKSTLFVQFLEKRKKHFAAKRAEEKRNMPPTRAQQRIIMRTYLKNMTGWKPRDLKNKSFANIQELFDKAFKRVNTFVDFRTELVEGTEIDESSKKAEVMEESSSKRAGDELEQENAKKQKVDDDLKAAKMKELMKIVPDVEEVAVDAIHLATKPPSIVDWKIVKEGNISYYQIIRADGSSRSTTAKLPMLKQGEYEMWKLRIKQYFQVQDYALWDVIENGNSFKPAAQTTTNADSSSTTLIPGPVTVDEKTQKKNDVKARSMLLMALPNEHLLTFNQYKDAKTLFAAIQTRFGESLEFIFNRLQKIVSQLAILGENISQEDLNLKLLRSLPSEWNTYVVVWRNKPNLDTMSFDDLYNNFKIVEQEVKGIANSSSSSSSQNMAFVSTPSSTNEVNTAYEVNTANTQVSTASAQDLEQIHEDDLEEMDLKWQLALLSMRTRRFFQKTSRKITINGSDTAGYDKSKVECFNYHKLGHFARECRGPRNQDSRNWNQDSSRRTVNVEETSSKAMLAIDGAGFDWSYMADDEVPTNMALMAFSDSEVYNDKTCSKTCLKSFETLKTQLDDLRIEFNKSEFNLATYKRGLASVEEQLVFYKKNEVLFCEQIVVLKRDISYKDSEISMLKNQLEKLKQEKESNQLKIENFDNASKSLDKLIGSQITDKSRKGVGFVSYNAVPPPPTGLFSPPTLDLSNSGLEEFQQPEFEGYGPKTSKSVSEVISNEVRETPDAPLVEELVSNDKLEKKIVSPTKIEFVRPKQQEKPVKYAKMYRSQGPRGNQRNWNNQKSQQLGSNFVMYNKACFICGSFDHVQANCNYHQRERVVSRNNYTRMNYNCSAKKAHPSAYKNMAPRALLMKTSPRPLNTARLVDTAHHKTIVHSARPMLRFSKSAQSIVKRPYQIKTTLTNNNFCQKVNIAKGSFYTARLKAVNTARPKTVNTVRPNSTVVNAVRANQINAVKGHPQKVQEDQGYVDSGCSSDKHNMVAYLKKPTGSEGFQEIVDFLNGSHIRYALTKNPSIYVSLIKKFWQTTTVRTVDNGEQEITATVDGKEFTFTEASVRRHL
ncbi:ribonuclease H-like domain-containing protein [Tanacetum coccineum]|uniref:Ribonuclease H-like domain-containing protein n=1 Tax=Tanacetum coccineum TaxID=301880 RepID=A0ABQ5A274_9ASTR